MDWHKPKQGKPSNQDWPNGMDSKQTTLTPCSDVYTQLRNIKWKIFNRKSDAQITTLNLGDQLYDGKFATKEDLERCHIGLRNVLLDCKPSAEDETDSSDDEEEISFDDLVNRVDEKRASLRASAIRLRNDIDYYKSILSQIEEVEQHLRKDGVAFEENELAPDWQTDSHRPSPRIADVVQNVTEQSWRLNRSISLDISPDSSLNLSGAGSLTSDASQTCARCRPVQLHPTSRYFSLSSLLKSQEAINKEKCAEKKRTSLEWPSAVECNGAEVGQLIKAEPVDVEQAQLAYDVGWQRSQLLQTVGASVDHSLAGRRRRPVVSSILSNPHASAVATKKSARQAHRRRSSQVPDSYRIVAVQNSHVKSRSLRRSQPTMSTSKNVRTRLRVRNDFTGKEHDERRRRRSASQSENLNLFKKHLAEKLTQRSHYHREMRALRNRNNNKRKIGQRSANVQKDLTISLLVQQLLPRRSPRAVGHSQSADSPSLPSVGVSSSSSSSCSSTSTTASNNGDATVSRSGLGEETSTNGLVPSGGDVTSAPLALPEDPYHVDNIVIYQSSVAAPLKIERPNYKELITPRWRKVNPFDPVWLMEEGLLDDYSGIFDEADDDITDEAVLERHERAANRERLRIQSVLQSSANSRFLLRSRQASGSTSAGPNTTSSVSSSSGPARDVSIHITDPLTGSASAVTSSAVLDNHASPPDSGVGSIDVNCNGAAGAVDGDEVGQLVGAEHGQYPLTPPRSRRQSKSSSSHEPPDAEQHDIADLDDTDHLNDEHLVNGGGAHEASNNDDTSANGNSSRRSLVNGSLAPTSDPRLVLAKLNDVIGLNSQSPRSTSGRLERSARRSSYELLANGRGNTEVESGCRTLTGDKWPYWSKRSFPLSDKEFAALARGRKRRRLTDDTASSAAVGSSIVGTGIVGSGIVGSSCGTSTGSDLELGSDPAKNHSFRMLDAPVL